jgi:hypothetical protein
MVELALSEPAGLAPELGGPRLYDAVDLFRSYLRATHGRRPIVRVWLPGAAARAIRGGANLTSETIGHRTWEAFLADRVAASP